jgi:hypothetical protein
VLTLSPISLISGAVDEATEWLEEHGEDKTSDRISAVSELVTGFASAYGVELLATGPLPVKLWVDRRIRQF